MHGYLAITALVLHTILILIVIVPSFTSSIGEIGELTAIASLTVWSHVVLDHSRSLRHHIDRSLAFKANIKNYLKKTEKVDGTLIHILGCLNSEWRVSAYPRIAVGFKFVLLWCKTVWSEKSRKRINFSHQCICACPFSC